MVPKGGSDGQDDSRRVGIINYRPVSCVVESHHGINFTSLNLYGKYHFTHVQVYTVTYNRWSDVK